MVHGEHISERGENCIQIFLILIQDCKFVKCMILRCTVHLCVAILREVIERHLAPALELKRISDRMLKPPALFIKWIDLMADLKKTWSKEPGNGTQSEILWPVSPAKLLVLDEIGVQYFTNAERVTLFQILDHRYENLLPTIITTNLSFEHLRQLVGERIVDRIQDYECGNRII